MADDRRPRPFLPFRFFQKRRQSIRVVDMAVRVDRRVNPLAIPLAHILKRALLRDGMKRTGVDEHEAVIGFQRAEIGKRFIERHARRDFLDDVHRRKGVAFRLRGRPLTRPKFFRCLSH